MTESTGKRVHSNTLGRKVLCRRPCNNVCVKSTTRTLSCYALICVSIRVESTAVVDALCVCHAARSSLFPAVFVTGVLPISRWSPLNMIGVFTSYHSFFTKGSTLHTTNQSRTTSITPYSKGLGVYTSMLSEQQPLLCRLIRYSGWLTSSSCFLFSPSIAVCSCRLPLQKDGPTRESSLLRMRRTTCRLWLCNHIIPLNGLQHGSTQVPWTLLRAMLKRRRSQTGDALHEWYHTVQQTILAYQVISIRSLHHLLVVIQFNSIQFNSLLKCTMPHGGTRT